MDNLEIVQKSSALYFTEKRSNVFYLKPEVFLCNVAPKLLAQNNCTMVLVYQRRYVSSVIKYRHFCDQEIILNMEDEGCRKVVLNV